MSHVRGAEAGRARRQGGREGRRRCQRTVLVPLPSFWLQGELSEAVTRLNGSRWLLIGRMGGESLLNASSHMGKNPSGCPHQLQVVPTAYPKTKMCSTERDVGFSVC